MLTLLLLLLLLLKNPECEACFGEVDESSEGRMAAALPLHCCCALTWLVTVSQSGSPSHHFGSLFCSSRVGASELDGWMSRCPHIPNQLHATDAPLPLLPQTKGPDGLSCGAFFIEGRGRGAGDGERRYLLREAIVFVAEGVVDYAVPWRM